MQAVLRQGERDVSDRTLYENRQHEDRLRSALSGWATPRCVVVASADVDVRSRLSRALTAMRWRVQEAAGGADAVIRLETTRPEALLVDSWLPDLEISEFCSLIERTYPALEILRLDGVALTAEIRSPRRHELLLALRDLPISLQRLDTRDTLPAFAASTETGSTGESLSESLPELVGESDAMRELATMIRLVAPTGATVLIEGETGTGKELVAHAVHRLSLRRDKPIAILNCAAIPEALLEAELFGHVRGAFTGAVQSRTGRIAAADGGTLFLDEIGEMPLALQAKMLRFVECGEVQRVGDNELIRVDVRVVAATHRMLEQQAEEGRFRLDLYHRLAVFPIEVPALRDRLQDLPLLVEHILHRLAARAPRKRISDAAMQELMEHRWPGNVRELIHVLERGAILAGEQPEIEPSQIRIRRRPR